MKRKPKVKRVRKVLTPAQKEKRVKTFKMFSRLVVGAVKIWLKGNPYIVLANEVDDFIKAYPEGLPANDEVDNKKEPD